MKTGLVNSLLLGLAGRQSNAGQAAPSCVAECTENVASQATVQGMHALCYNVAKQRAMFDCLISSCRPESYGHALAYAVSTCSDLGADISPLHPIEVHHVTPAKRQSIPTEPGPVLPGSSTLYSRQLLPLDHEFSVALDCRTGFDGLVTVSLGLPFPTANPFSNSNGGSDPTNEGGPGGDAAPKGSTTLLPDALPSDPVRSRIGGTEGPGSDPSGASAAPGRSTALTGTQDTGCPCQVSSTGTRPLSTSATSFQVPAEQQTGSLPCSTTALSSSGYPDRTSRPQSEDCEETSSLVISITTAPSPAQSSPSLISATQSLSFAQASNCSENAAASMPTPPRISSAPSSTTFATSSWSTSTLPSLALTPQDPCSNSSSVHTMTTLSTSSSASSLTNATSCAEDHTSSTLVTTLRPATSSEPEVTDCSTETSDGLSHTSVTASLHQASANATSATPRRPSLSTAFTSPTSMILTTGPPSYKTMAPPTLPAYVPPLAEYSYGKAPAEYGTPSARTSPLPTTSDIGPSGQPRLSLTEGTTPDQTTATLVEEKHPRGTFSDGAQESVNTAVVVTVISTAANGEMHTTVRTVEGKALYATDAPLPTDGDSPKSGSEVRAHEKSQNDVVVALAMSDSDDRTARKGPISGRTHAIAGPEATNGFAQLDHATGGTQAISTVMSSGFKALMPRLSLVCATVLVAMSAI